ncbi:putative neural-cadherin 2 [Penaeus japonicus]|uniref:putative neural-cadherin 2 n=1 Tax=Penaeus japonicus TaxID=27405 RepID=UPI001C71521C|nr:putative neural-cadherin 2 [Penaeus japonicus]
MPCGKVREIIMEENGKSLFISDLLVTTIAALDADDATEGSNARLTYAIEKNAVEEGSGEVLFRVEPRTGVIRTSRCCLDRETTPEYNIQVVASDGGGLKGTVVIRLVDVNDNSPRLAHRHYNLELNETFGDRDPDNTTLLELLAADRDTTNYFFYRVVEGSGWGWEHFGVRTAGAAGQVFARHALDFENEAHRRGFRIMIQVTDRGRGGWDNPRHLDAGWVSIGLLDLNDNPPEFLTPVAHVTLREDAAPGTSLASLVARDADEGGQQEVEYRMKDAWKALAVTKDGTVTLQSALDREASDGGLVVAEVLAVDRGSPPLTATATLTVVITDVNDCPPVLTPPTVLHVQEHAQTPALLTTLTADDEDVWAMGHGPPFNLSLAPNNPPHVLEKINLKFNPCE